MPHPASKSAELTVSYCVTCRARLTQLKQTLAANLLAEQGNNVEFVILDYDCPEGTSDWVKASFPNEVAAGRILVARHTPAPHFKMAHAKNMAHRLATGEIICNVDADNFIAKDFSRWLVKIFAKDPDIIVTSRPLTVATDIAEKFGSRLYGRDRPLSDLSGRIAIARANFVRLGGYDERFNGHGMDDVNFGLRALSLGMKAVRLPQAYWGKVILHGDDARLQQLSPEDRKKSVNRMSKSRLQYILVGMLRLMRRPPPLANEGDDVGCGDVYLNFDVTSKSIARLSNST